jgi:hypothetical protein
MRRQSSKPLIPGMMTSLSTRSYVFSRSSAMASSPLAAVWVP